MNIDKNALREIISEVVKETLERQTEREFLKEKDESGIIKIRPSTVKCEQFQGAEGVYLKDIVTLEEAPRMGAGIMELDHTSFEWTLTYDEYDYVIDGELEIEIGRFSGLEFAPEKRAETCASGPRLPCVLRPPSGFERRQA